MQLYVIRHALSEANAAGLIQGQTNSRLTDIGFAQAGLLGRFLRSRGVKPDRIYSSPLTRAYDTAKTIAQNLESAPEVVRDQGFMEIDTGSLSEISMEDAFRRFPEENAAGCKSMAGLFKIRRRRVRGIFGRIESAALEIMSNATRFATKPICLWCTPGLCVRCRSRCSTQEAT